MSEHAPTSQDSVRRGLLPEILWASDLPAALGVRTGRTAVQLVLRHGIPHGRLGRRLYVRRVALLEWLASHEGPLFPGHPVIRG
jgi:hypothetical protein